MVDGRDRAAAELRCLAKTAAWGYGTVVMMDRRERAAAALLGEQRGGGDGRAGELRRRGAAWREQLHRETVHKKFG